jgi:hypothetical protein
MDASFETPPKLSQNKDKIERQKTGASRRVIQQHSRKTRAMAVAIAIATSQQKPSLQSLTLVYNPRLRRYPQEYVALKTND